MKKNKSFDTLQQLDLIRNRYQGDISLIIEKLIDLIQIETEQLYNSQNKENIEQLNQDNQQKLLEKIELLVSKVDEQCQTYAKQVIDYIFQINSNNISLLDIQLKNVLISIKSFVKRPQNKPFVNKLKAQVISDLMKVQQADNSIQYYDEIQKNNSNQDSPQKKKKKNQKDEGFISSESEMSDTDKSEQQDKDVRKKFDNNNFEEARLVEDQEKMYEEDSESPFKLKQTIKNLEQQVLELKEKVVNRECILSEITYGYMKDVSHWKEIFNRKDRDFQNCFEVSYFEPSIIYDDKIREVLNSRLQDLKMQCENKMYQMQKKFKRHQEEFEKLQETLFAFMSQNDPISVAKTLFAMETNPHKIWKILQDQMGNAYFFRIFEQQRAGYGIRYKEIDELISQSKASSREYDELKRQIKYQMEKMVERSQQEIESIRKEVAEKEKEIEQIRIGFSQDLENVRQETIKQMEEQFKAREEKLYEDFEERRKDIYEQLGNRNFERIIEESQLKLFFQKWMFAAKLMKVKDSLDELEEQSIEKKQDFLKKYILRQVTQPLQQSKKLVDLPGSLFQSKRIKARVSQRHSVISIQQRVRQQSNQQDDFSDIQNEQSQKDHSLLSSKVTQKLEKKPSENFKIDRKPSILQERNLEYSEKKMADSTVFINDGVSEKEKAKEDIVVNEGQNNVKQIIVQQEEDDIDIIFELEMQIDALNQQIQEQQNQKSGLEERISFLNKQVERVTQELHCQRDFNTQFKNDNRELKLKITLYEDTFSEIAQKIGISDLKILDFGDSNNKKAKNFMKTISNANKQDQNGFILALETQQTKNEAADQMLGEKFKEKGTGTKIQGINENLSVLEQQQKEIEAMLQEDSLDKENAVINVRERVRSDGLILEDKETQTDFQMKDIDFRTKKKLKRSTENSPNQQKTVKKKEKSLFDKFDVDELEKSSQMNLNRNLSQINQLESPQFMKQRYNNKLNTQDKMEQDSSDEERKNYDKRNSVWERLFNDQFDRKKREEELKKQLESIEEKHWQEILKILNLYSQQKFDAENELKPFFPKYAPKKKQFQAPMFDREQKRCYTPNIEQNKVRNNSSNKETILNQSSTFNVVQEQRTPPSQQTTIGLQKIKTRADHFYKKLQTEPSQTEIQSHNIYVLSSNGKERHANELSSSKQEYHADNTIKTSPFEYFANIYNKQQMKQNIDNQYKSQMQFLQKYPQLDKTFNQQIFPVSSIPSSNSKQQQQPLRNRSYSINKQKNISMSDKKESQTQNQNKQINQNKNLGNITLYQTQGNGFYFNKFSQAINKKTKQEMQKQNILPIS